MISILAALLLTSPAHAKIDFELTLVENKEICRGVYETIVLVNNEYKDYYYDYDTGIDPNNCLVHTYDIEGYPDRYGL